MHPTIRTAGCAGVWFVALLASCATTSNDDCQRQVSDCIARCERAEPSTNPAKSVYPPETTLTECESRCNCRKSQPVAPAPAGPPTFTGSAPPATSPR